MKNVFEDNDNDDNNNNNNNNNNSNNNNSEVRDNSDEDEDDNSHNNKNFKSGIKEVKLESQPIFCWREDRGSFYGRDIKRKETHSFIANDSQDILCDDWLIHPFIH